MRPLKLRVVIKQEKWNGPWHMQIVDNEGMVVAKSREIKKQGQAVAYTAVFRDGLAATDKVGIEPCVQAEIPGIGEYV